VAEKSSTQKAWFDLACMRISSLGTNETLYELDRSTEYGTCEIRQCDVLVQDIWHHVRWEDGDFQITTALRSHSSPRRPLTVKS
jgi:hypothetical protein